MIVSLIEQQRERTHMKQVLKICMVPPTGYNPNTVIPEHIVQASGLSSPNKTENTTGKQEGVYSQVYFSHKAISLQSKWVKADKNESSIHMVSGKGPFCTAYVVFTVYLHRICYSLEALQMPDTSELRQLPALLTHYQQSAVTGDEAINAQTTSDYNQCITDFH